MESQAREPRPRYGERVAIAVVLLVIFFGPTLCTLRYPAPLGRTIWGVRHRLDRDLPKGTSMDSAVVLLNRVGVDYWIASSHEIRGREVGVQTSWPNEGDLIFRILFDNHKRVVRDTVYKEVIFP